MDIQEVRSVFINELPAIMRNNDKIRQTILDIAKKRFADQDESDRRFDRIMDELVAQRKENKELWEKHRLEDKEHWEKHRLEDKASRDKHRLEDKESWEKHHKEHKEILAQIAAIVKKHDSSIGALGARWGMNSEKSFRNGLKGILEENFDIQVETVNYFDKEGDVFGRPDQVELDIILKNGLLIICELKSSVSKSDMYIFERKVRFYEKRHNRKASKMMVISPMVDPFAQKVADKLGIEVYTHALNVETL